MVDSSANSSSNSVVIDSAKEYVEKLFDLKIRFTDDLYAYDAKWSLFVAAASSYRYNSQLKPFPPMFRNLHERDIEKLNRMINDTPTFSNILNNINEKCYDNLDPNVIDLLHWILIKANDSNLRTISNQEMEILSKKYFNKNDAKPTCIFEVCPSKGLKIEENFSKHKEEFDTEYGFHGSKIDSFYSILHSGLHQHMCKKAIYGEGIYLSTELSTSFNYSPHGATWGASSCGSLVSCVALCEYITNPKHCRVVNESKQLNQNKKDEKFIVITNDEMIRVRYLLFYVKDNICRKKANSLMNWIRQHRYFLAVCCYAILLASVGFINQGGALYLRHLLNKKCEEILKVFRTYFS